MKTLIFCLVALSLSPLSRAAAPEAPVTRLTWLGHAAYKIVTPSGKTLLIDPWVGNPLNPANRGETPEKALENAIKDLGPVDFILITHGHFDHVADATAIAKRTGARLIANFELGQNMVRVLGFPANQTGYDTLGNAGGTLSYLNGDLTVTFTQAVHSSGLDSGKDHEAIAYGGNPVGFVIRMKNGPAIYHSGDTALFSDMALIGSTLKPDVALLNIGGHFGMEPAEAARAASLVHAKLTIPHHYKTFPVLTQDPASFFRALDRQKLKHRELKPGETIEFTGSNLK
ncbi:MAG: metal-dependent hydrolase [Proteobacteria bacterium]|nr:metal-dependent hydrolase [Pseudomonadota bacterium]